MVEILMKTNKYKTVKKDPFLLGVEINECSRMVLQNYYELNLQIC